MRTAATKQAGKVDATTTQVDEEAPAKKLALNIDAAEWVPDTCLYLSSSTPLTKDDADHDHTYNANTSLTGVPGIHSDESQPWLQYGSTKKSKLAQPANDRAANASNDLVDYKIVVHEQNCLLLRDNKRFMHHSVGVGRSTSYELVSSTIALPSAASAQFKACVTDAVTVAWSEFGLHDLETHNEQAARFPKLWAKLAKCCDDAASSWKNRVFVFVARYSHGPRAIFAVDTERRLFLITASFESTHKKDQSEYVPDARFMEEHLGPHGACLIHLDRSCGCKKKAKK